MKNPDELITEEGFSLTFQECKSEEILIDVPKAVLISLERSRNGETCPFTLFSNFILGKI
jgi:hypothetical protein